VPLFAAVDLGRQLLNAVQWLMGDNNSVHVQGEGLMEVIAWRRNRASQCTCLTTNGPNAFRGRMRRPVTLANQSVRVQLPREVKIKTASLLRAETNVQFKQTGRIVELTVPSIKIYKVVAHEV
jgi:hypothetical protein